MTKTNTKSSHRVPIFRRPIFIIFVLIIAATVIGVMIWFRNRPSSDPIVSNPTPASEDAVLPSKPSDTTSSDDQDIPDAPPQYEGENPNTLDSLSGRIAYHGVDNGTLTIMATIDQYLQSDGSCTLHLLRDGREAYSATLPASADVTTSVCGPFNVPVSSLSSGAYDIKIILSAAGKTGTITGTAEI